MTEAPGAHAHAAGTRFEVRSPYADAVHLCLFDGEAETRLPMTRAGDAWALDVPGIRPGQRYGYRAAGEYAPDRNRWFDPAKLLVDPYAQELDRRFAYDPRLSLSDTDTTDLVPRAIVPAPAADPIPLRPPFVPGRLA